METGYSHVSDQKKTQDCLYLLCYSTGLSHTLHEASLPAFLFQNIPKLKKTHNNNASKTQDPFYHICLLYPRLCMCAHIASVCTFTHAYVLVCLMKCLRVCVRHGDILCLSTSACAAQEPQYHDHTQDILHFYHAII